MLAKIVIVLLGVTQLRKNLDNERAAHETLKEEVRALCERVLQRSTRASQDD